MYQIFWNSEPHITTFDESKYFFTFLGSFVAFLCILIFTIFVRKVPYILYLVIPLCFSIFFVYTSSPSVIKYVQNVISILQVPVLIAEAFLFALLTKRITAFLSKQLTKKYQNTSLYNITTYVLSSIIIIISTVALFYGFDTSLISLVQGISFGALLCSFIITIYYSDGVMLEEALLYSRTVLSLAPITSASTGALTMLIRFIFVLSSLISISFQKVPIKKNSKKNDFAVIFNRIEVKIALTLTLISYIMLNPYIFIRPSEFSCKIQSIAIPIIFVILLFFRK